MKRRDPFPGAKPVSDRHGKRRIRFRRTIGGVKIDTYLPGSYGSVEFRAAYEAAVESAKAPNRSKAALGTFAWLIETYLSSSRFRNLSGSRKRAMRGELDWLRQQIGDLPFKMFGVRHVEALMGKKAGPTAANTVKKNLSTLFNFAIRQGMGVTFNPARHAERLRENPDGYNTWTEAEVDRFLDVHGPDTQARLCLLLAFNTGMARQDLARAGWQDVAEGRITYRRGKTHVGASLPIMPDLAEELALIPRDRLLFLKHGDRHLPYQPATLSNWFRRKCKAAQVPGSLHGLRKAGATRLADAGATPDEIRAFLAHKTNKEGSTYTNKADRSRLADSGLAKVQAAKGQQKLSNLPPKLDKEAGN